MANSIRKPRNTMIEKVAGQLAATWYEVGRGQGMTSKWSTAKLYAQNNLEKFIPVAIKYMFEMLNNPSFPREAKEEIYDELMERANDPNNIVGTDFLPDVDIKKLLAAVPPPSQALKPVREKPLSVLTSTTADTKKPNINEYEIPKLNPFRASRH